MLYREIIAVCSQIHTNHINTLCGQNVELLNVKLVVRIVTTGSQRIPFSRRALTQEAVSSKDLAVRQDSFNPTISTNTVRRPAAIRQFATCRPCNALSSCLGTFQDAQRHGISGCQQYCWRLLTAARHNDMSVKLPAAFSSPSFASAVVCPSVRTSVCCTQLAHCCASLECGTPEGGLGLAAGHTLRLNVQGWVVGLLWNVDLEGMWKETAVGCLRYCAGLEGLSTTRRHSLCVCRGLNPAPAYATVK